MNTIEPTPQGWANEPGTPKKSNTWVWILGGVVVLCLCLGLVISALGLYYYLAGKGTDVFAGIPTQANLPLQPTPPVMATERPAPTAVPQVELPDTVIVEFYQPPLTGPEYYSLYQYALDYNYDEQLTPVTETYEVDLASLDTVVVDSGWCTIDAATLDENFEHITFELEVDGVSVDLNDLYTYTEPLEDRICRSYAGLVRAWPPGDHVIIQRQVFDEVINDGWNDYQAGTYTNIFNIHVTP